VIKISDEAAEKAKEILAAEGKAGSGLRIFLAGSSCCGPSFGMDISDNPDDNDETFEKNGLKVFVDKTASEKLNGMEIHFVSEGDQQGFVVRGNTPSSCGPSCSSC
jgi:iron-sulfur cluster assembly accessory protein